MSFENMEIYLKQFNAEFESELEERKKETPTLLRMYHDYIEQTFKKNKTYDKVLDKIIGIEDELNNSFTEEQKKLFEKCELYRDELSNLTEEQSFIYGFCLDKELSLEKQKIQHNLNNNTNNNTFFCNYIDSIMQFIEDNRFNIWTKKENYKEITDKMKSIKNKYPNIRTFVDERQNIQLTEDEQKALLEYICLDSNIQDIELAEVFKLGIKEGKML